MVKKDLSDFLKQRFDTATQETILRDLESLNIPIPDYEQYMNAKDGIIIPIGAYASVIRIHSSENYPLVKSEYLLTPIAAIQVNDETRLDIQPTGEYLPDMNEKTFHKLEDQMAKIVEKREGIIMGDTFPLNWITVDKQHIGQRGLQMLNFDPHTIELKDPTIHKPARYFKNSTRIWDTEDIAKNTVQGQYFAEHRAAFLAAYDPETGTLTPNGIKAFWDTMKQSKQKGKLVVDWNWKREGEDHSKMHISEIDRNYSQRMSSEVPEVLI